MEVLLEPAAAPTVRRAVEARDINKATFRNWRKRFLGEVAQKAIDDIDQDELPGEIDSLKEKIAELEAEARLRKMEVAIWRGGRPSSQKKTRASILSVWPTRRRRSQSAP